MRSNDMLIWYCQSQVFVWIGSYGGESPSSAFISLVSIKIKWSSSWISTWEILRIFENTFWSYRFVWSQVPKAQSYTATTRGSLISTYLFHKTWSGLRRWARSTLGAQNHHHRWNMGVDTLYCEIQMMFSTKSNWMSCEVLVYLMYWYS